jgi:hypothetical protein
MKLGGGGSSLKGLNFNTSNTLLYLYCIYNIYIFNPLHLRCRKLPKALKEWDAFLELKKTIDDFSESCPLLELMANKAMKERHWDRLANLTGHKFDVENENFQLRNIMEAPLLKNKEDIEVIFINKN